MADVWTELIFGPLPVERATEFLHGNSSLGAFVTFEGATRGQLDSVHGPLSYLEYEAYGQMADSQLKRIAGHAVREWKLGKVAILHRLGRVGLGEVSVFIGVAAAHRAEAFDACRWLIDILKVEVPIWKKDVFADGFTQWVEPNPGQTSVSIGGIMAEVKVP